MALRRVWITENVLQMGVRAVDAEVVGDMATCRIGGVLRIFRDQGLWATTRREAMDRVRERCVARLEKLEAERARIEGLMVTLDRGELPGIPREA